MPRFELPEAELADLVGHLKDTAATAVQQAADSKGSRVHWDLRWPGAGSGGVVFLGAWTTYDPRHPDHGFACCGTLDVRVTTEHEIRRDGVFCPFRLRPGFKARNLGADAGDLG